MILLTTIHDPYIKLSDEIERYSSELNQIFDEIFICISNQTNRSIINQCIQYFKNTKIIKKRGAADARRKALNFALSTDISNSQMLMYCDFDRIITWIKLYPDELSQITRNSYKSLNKDYILIGRTEKSFNTHPPSWKDTELVTNKIAALTFNIKNLDVTAGASIFTLNSAKQILSSSNHSHTDCEWPKIISQNLGSIGEIKVDGLAYTDMNSANSISEIREYYDRLLLSTKITSILLDDSIS